jgi:hypothetical protein
MLDTVMVPRTGDTITLPGTGMALVRNVHWDYENGIVHVHIT